MKSLYRLPCLLFLPLFALSACANEAPAPANDPDPRISRIEERLRAADPQWAQSRIPLESDIDWASLTEEEWQARLPEGSFRVLCQDATERPNSSPLLQNQLPGAYHCAGCDLPLFSSTDKFDSRTGWPSYYRPKASNVVGMRIDQKLAVPRVEVHCNRCGGHLGHVFEDAPESTGLRFCINGLALRFEPESSD